MSATPTPARWLLLFNCQAPGLASSLEVLHGNLVVDSYDALASQLEIDTIRANLDAYERIVIAPRVRTLVAPDIVERANVTWVPHIWFQGYHPDLCYLAGGGPLAGGPMGSYHSAIAYSAWRAGYDLDATLALYNAANFRELRYPDAWAASRDQLLATFRGHGLDIGAEFVEWSRRGPFMHSINHPKIGVLLGVARVVLRTLGHAVRDSGVQPPDNLVKGPVFPVYPEIGAPLGVAGCYDFKPGGGFSLLDLRQFVAASHEYYREHAAAVPDHPEFLALLEKVDALIARRRGAGAAAAAISSPARETTP